MRPIKRRKPSDLLKQQKETGLSYWDMIGYPLPEVTVTSTYPYEDRVWDTVDNLDTRKEPVPEFINRLHNNDRRYIIDESNGTPATFLMNNDGKYAYPLIQDVNGTLHNYDTKYGDYWDRQPYENGDYIKFSTPGDARYFAEHYKDHYPEYFKGFRNGKSSINLPGYDDGTSPNNSVRYNMADDGRFIATDKQWTPAGSFLYYGAASTEQPGLSFYQHPIDYNYDLTAPAGLIGIGVDNKTGKRFTYTPLLDEVVVKPDNKLMKALKEYIPNDNVRKEVLLQLDNKSWNNQSFEPTGYYSNFNFSTLSPNYPVQRLLELIDVAGVPNIKRTEVPAPDYGHRPHYDNLTNTIHDRPYGGNNSSYIDELYHALLYGVAPFIADELALKQYFKYRDALKYFDAYEHPGTLEYNAHSELPELINKYLFPKNIQGFLYDPIAEIEKSMKHADKVSNPSPTRGDSNNELNLTSPMIPLFLPGFELGKPTKKSSFVLRRTNPARFNTFANTIGKAVYMELKRRGQYTPWRYDNIMSLLSLESWQGTSDAAYYKHNYGGRRLPGSTDYITFKDYNDFVKNQLDYLYRTWPEAWNAKDSTSYANALWQVRNGHLKKYMEADQRSYGNDLRNLKSARKAWLSRIKGWDAELLKQQQQSQEAPVLVPTPEQPVSTRVTLPATSLLPIQQSVPLFKFVQPVSYVKPTYNQIDQEKPLYTMLLPPINQMMQYFLTGDVPYLNELLSAKNGKASGIHIKPSHRGRFTSYLKAHPGMTAEKAKHSKSAAVRKMATFALNARKWRH